MKKFILILFILMIIIGIVVVTYLPNYLSISANDRPVEIEIPSGASLGSVAGSLFENGIIRSKLWFRYKGQDIAKNIKPGTYTIESKISIDEIYEIIQQGEQLEQIKITFPEGFILYQMAEKVEDAGIGSRDGFIEATNTYFATKGYNFDTSSLYFNMEGYLFPDTYYFNKGQDISNVVSKLADTMDNVFSEEYIDRAKELGLSKHEILTIASLIEREAYNDEERARISGVIYNRLDKGMLLQIDATVIYGLGEGKEHMTRVLYADLEKENPYNTYKNLGLPPGPIASPGKNSIIAALYPEEHDYFYYVFAENGHVFSKTYDEHLVNVNKYRK